MNFQRILAFACSIILSSTLGCSSGSTLPQTVAVTGEVLYQGKPADGAEVAFNTSAPGAKPARGKTDAQGKFTLKTYVDPQHDLDGAIPGEYEVTVTKLELPPPMTAEDMSKMGSKPMPLPKDLLPAKYSTAAKTDLKASVKAGDKNDFKFELKD